MTCRRCFPPRHLQVYYNLSPGHAALRDECADAVQACAREQNQRGISETGDATAPGTSRNTRLQDWPGQPAAERGQAPCPGGAGRGSTLSPDGTGRTHGRRNSAQEKNNTIPPLAGRGQGRREGRSQQAGPRYTKRLRDRAGTASHRAEHTGNSAVSSQGAHRLQPRRGTPPH